MVLTLVVSFENFPCPVTNIITMLKRTQYVTVETYAVRHWISHTFRIQKCFKWCEVFLLFLWIFFRSNNSQMGTWITGSYFYKSCTLIVHILAAQATNYIFPRPRSTKERCSVCLPFLSKDSITKCSNLSFTAQTLA
jgi:hypothetical protein